jgi:hypothetical protein
MTVRTKCFCLFDGLQAVVGRPRVVSHYGQQHRKAYFSVDATSVENHHPGTDGWKIVRDLVIVEARVLRQNLLKQQAKLRDVPLTVAQVENAPIDCILRRHSESAVEGAVGPPHHEVSAQDEHWFPHRVYDAVASKREWRSRLRHIAQRPSFDSWDGEEDFDGLRVQVAQHRDRGALVGRRSLSSFATYYQPTITILLQNSRRSTWFP